MELPTHLSKAADTNSDFDPLEWWQRNSETLPSWLAAARKVLLIQPSSAATERAVSLLNLSFGDQQDSSLQDYIEASIMMQFNNR